MKTTLYFITSLSLAIFIFSIGSAQGDSSVTSEFFYYSSDEDAFIIEDFTESQRNVVATFSEDRLFVGGPGWSPSGEWLAWSVVRCFACGGEIQGDPIAYMVNRNSEQVNLADYLNLSGDPIVGLSWNDTEDLLLVDGTYIFNPNTFEFHSISVDKPLSWFHEYLINAFDGTIEMYQQDGTLVYRQPVDAAYYAGWGQNAVHDLVYIYNEQLVIADYKNNAVKTTYRLRNQSIKYIVWTLSGDKAVIYLEDSVLLYSDSDKSIQIIAENHMTFEYLQPRGRQSTPQRLAENTWSQDFMKVFLQDVDRNLYIYDISTQELNQLPPIDGEPHFAGWSNDAAFILEAFQNSLHIIKYINNSSQIVYSMTLSDGFGEFVNVDISPFGRYIILATEFPYNGLLIDLQEMSAEIIFVRMRNEDPEGFQFLIGSEWNQTEEWVLLKAGDRTYEALSILNVVTLEQQHLSTCSGAPSCGGWMP